MPNVVDDAAKLVVVAIIGRIADDNVDDDVNTNDADNDDDDNGYD